MRIKARSTFNPFTNLKLGIPKGNGLLLLQVGDEYRARLGEQLAILIKRQAGLYNKAVEKHRASGARGPAPNYADTLVELELDLTIHFRKRSINATALWWKLLEIEANWINGTPAYRSGYWSKKTPGQIVTPAEIHEDELETYAVKTAYFVPKDDVFGFTRGVEVELGKVKRKEPVGDGNTYRVEVWRTTSYLDTKEFSPWVKRKIDQITEGGLLKTDIDEFLQLREDFKKILEEGKGK
jgi:hypothetical protein